MEVDANLILRAGDSICALASSRASRLVLAISRGDVARGVVGGCVASLQELTDSRECFERWQGLLELRFDGWTARRDIESDRRARDFVRALSAQWPYWWHFCSCGPNGLVRVLRLLCLAKAATASVLCVDPVRLHHVQGRLALANESLYDAMRVDAGRQQVTRERALALAEDAVF